MQNEIYIVAGAAVTALAAFATAKITTGIQLDIARLNAEKDVKLQKDRLHDDRLKNELVVEREKLDILHQAAYSTSCSGECIATCVPSPLEYFSWVQ